MTYFAQNLRHLRKRSSKTQEQLGQDIRLGRTTIANYEAGFSSPTDPEVLVRLAQVFAVSIDELLTRDLGRAFGSHPAAPAPVAPALPAATSMPCVSLAGGNAYPTLRNDEAWLAALPRFSMPGLPPGTYRLFEVADAALAPRFSPGDQVVCRRLDQATDLRSGHPAVLLCAAHGLLLRRPVPGSGTTLRLLADAPAFSLLEVSADDVTECWAVLYVLSANLGPPPDLLYGRIAELEQQLLARPGQPTP